MANKWREASIPVSHLESLSYEEVQECCDETLAKIQRQAATWPMNASVQWASDVVIVNTLWQLSGLHLTPEDARSHPYYARLRRHFDTVIGLLKIP